MKTHLLAFLALAGSAYGAAGDIKVTAEQSGGSTKTVTLPALTTNDFWRGTGTPSAPLQVFTSTSAGRAFLSAADVAAQKTLLNLSGTNSGDQTITLTGDVTGSGTGSFAATIGAGKVTNSMLAGGIAAAKLTGTDIDTVGTLTSGTWHASTIGSAYGGLGIDASASTGFGKWASGTFSVESAATHLTSIGGTTAGVNIFKVPNPSAVTFLRINADNSVDTRSAANFRGDIGGTNAGQALFTLTDPSAITFPRINADNTASALSASSFRTAIGATTIGANLFTLTNPGAITFPRYNADNTVDALSASAFRTAIGAGTGGGDVIGPGTVTDTALMKWNGTDGFHPANSTYLLTSADMLQMGGTTSDSPALLPRKGRADTCTISNASPGVITISGGHDYIAGDAVALTTTGALPTGLTAGLRYFVTSTSLTGTTFTVSKTLGGTAVNTSSAGSGTHTATRIGCVNLLKADSSAQSMVRADAGFFDHIEINTPRSSGNIFRIDAQTGFSGNLISFNQNNSSVFQVSGTGAVTASGGCSFSGAGAMTSLQLQNNNSLTWSSGSQLNCNADGIFRFFSSGFAGFLIRVTNSKMEIRTGLNDAELSVKALQMESAEHTQTAVTGTNAAGVEAALLGGIGTGTGIPGPAVIRTGIVGTSGTTAHSKAIRDYAFGGEKSITESSATVVLNVAVASGKYVGGELIATTHADDGTDFQATTETILFSAVNKGGTVTTTIQAVPATSTTAASTGTLTTAWTAVANGNSVDLKNSAVSSLTQTTLAVTWQIKINGNGTAAVTP